MRFAISLDARVARNNTTGGYALAVHRNRKLIYLNSLCHSLERASNSATATSKAPNNAKESEDLNDVPEIFSDTHGVICSTMNDIPGYRVVKVLGTVYGLTVRSRNWGADIAALLRSSVGGELKYFTTMMYRSRNSAVNRMVGECLGRGGNAIIALRFDTGEIKMFAQVCVYGTACIVEKIEDEGKGKGAS